jgi:hypothetical protein
MDLSGITDQARELLKDSVTLDEDAEKLAAAQPQGKPSRRGNIDKKTAFGKHVKTRVFTDSKGRTYERSYHVTKGTRVRRVAT